jgi:hypothetical protein
MFPAPLTGRSFCVNFKFARNKFLTRNNLGKEAMWSSLLVRVAAWFKFWSAFAKLGMATIGFVMSVLPSVSMEQLGFHWTDFQENWCLNISRKSVQKFIVSLISHGIIDVSIFMITSRWILLRMRDVADKGCRENQNMHLMSNNFFFSKIVPFIT